MPDREIAARLAALRRACVDLERRLRAALSELSEIKARLDTAIERVT